MLAFLLMLLPTPLPAHGATIRGRITDAAGGAVVRAAVSLDGTGFHALTDPTGAYQLSGVPGGTYTLRVRRIGYRVVTAVVKIREGETVEQDVVVEPAPVALAPVDIVVGSRARHGAAEDLAVPVDIFDAEQVQAQGTRETSEVLSQLAPSVIFPRQSIADATDVVRPFVLRGLSPDHTLVLVNGKRRHSTALVHVFGVALGAGSSGVDLNAIPASAIERVEILRDGAAAQYGSDAIAGVVNVVLKEGAFPPQVGASWGRHTPTAFPDDGNTLDASGSWGLALGRGSVTLMAEYRSRDATNRAGADPFDQLVPGDGDRTDTLANTVLEKRNPVPQPTHHWGDGVSRDVLSVVNARLPLTPAATTELYAVGAYSAREGTGNGFRRAGLSSRNWPEIYPLGFLPGFAPHVADGSGVVGLRGRLSGWNYDVSGAYGANDFQYFLDHTLNVSLGPCLSLAPAACSSPPLGPDSVPGSGDEIPNQTSFYAGALQRSELIGTIDVRRQIRAGAARPVTLALGAALRRDTYRIVRGEPASYMQGWHPNRDGDPAPPGSQVFPGFRPANEADAARSNVGVYADLEVPLSAALLADVAARVERYSDVGEKMTGKVALRYQASRAVTFRGAASTGFRAPSLSQTVYGTTVTNFDPTSGELRDVAIFPVNAAAARALGARPLRAETSRNVSVGLVLNPGAGLTIAIDGFFIGMNGRIMMTSELSGPEIETLLASAGEPDVAAARFVSDALDTETAGVDVTASFRGRAGASGWLTVAGSYNRTRTEVRGSIPTVPTTSVPIFDEGGLNAITGERPRWRAAVTADYTDGRWSVLARANLYGAYRSSLWSFTDFQRYGAEALFDAEVARAFTNGVRLRVGIRNILDNFPDRTGQVNSYGIMQWPTASPFGFNGRLLYARLDATLGR